MSQSTAGKTSLNFETYIANIYYDNYNSHINDNYSNKGWQGEGYMAEVMKVKLKEYIEQMDDTDIVFMKQILTLVRLHIEKKQKNTGVQ